MQLVTTPFLLLPRAYGITRSLDQAEYIALVTKMTNSCLDYWIY